MSICCEYQEIVTLETDWHFGEEVLFLYFRNHLIASPAFYQNFSHFFISFSYHLLILLLQLQFSIFVILFIFCSYFLSLSLSFSLFLTLFSLASPPLSLWFENFFASFLFSLQFYGNNRNSRITSRVYLKYFLSCRQVLEDADCIHCSVGWNCRIHWLHLCGGVRHPINEYSGYDGKQSDVVSPVMLELRRIQSTPSLSWLPGLLWPGVVALDRVLSMGQIELFDI